MLRADKVVRRESWRPLADRPTRLPSWVEAYSAGHETGLKGGIPLMGQYGARVRTIRTTRDGAGQAYGIVTGMAATPDTALAELMRNAEARAESLDARSLYPSSHDPRTPAQQRAERLRELTEPFPEPASRGSFEVVDVRLTVGVMDGGGDGWLAYGTLAR